MNLRGPGESVPVNESGVAELQGLYGPFSFPEKLLQKIWLRGEYARQGCRTVDGRDLEVIYPGKWNLLGGPDFKQARLRLGGIELTGDVELHLHARDWAAHGHAADPAYDRVVLHVVLFPPGAGQLTSGANGTIIPELVLLPLLHHDLEEYAADEAVERFANRPMTQALQELGALEPSALRALMDRFAIRRWQMKVHFARLRLQRLGWEEACHQTALEILGYRFNRAAMVRVATRFPLPEWREGRVGAESAFAEEKERWSLHGVRPTNHPRVRLRQYERWVCARPDWPERLVRAAQTVPVNGSVTESTAEFRRMHGFPAWRAELSDNLCDTHVSGPRFDTLWCDGFLPLLAARFHQAVEAIWFHWFPGNLPPDVLRTLRLLEVIGRRSQPASHGAGQGLLGWLIEKENRAAAPGGAGVGRGA